MKLLVDGQEVGRDFFTTPHPGVHHLVIEEENDGRLVRKVIPRAMLKWKPTFVGGILTGYGFDIEVLPNPAAPRLTWWQKIAAAFLPGGERP